MSHPYRTRKSSLLHPFVALRRNFTTLKPQGIDSASFDFSLYDNPHDHKHEQSHELGYDQDDDHVEVERDGGRETEVASELASDRSPYSESTSWLGPAKSFQSSAGPSSRRRRTSYGSDAASEPPISTPTSPSIGLGLPLPPDSRSRLHRSSQSYRSSSAASAKSWKESHVPTVQEAEVDDRSRHSATMQEAQEDDQQQEILNFLPVPSIFPPTAADIVPNARARRYSRIAGSSTHSNANSASAATSTVDSSDSDEEGYVVARKYRAGFGKTPPGSLRRHPGKRKKRKRLAVGSSVSGGSRSGAGRATGGESSTDSGLASGEERSTPSSEGAQSEEDLYHPPPPLGASLPTPSTRPSTSGTHGTSGDPSRISIDSFFSVHSAATSIYPGDGEISRRKEEGDHSDCPTFTDGYAHPFDAGESHLRDTPSPPMRRSPGTRYLAPRPPVPPRNPLRASSPSSTLETSPTLNSALQRMLSREEEDGDEVIEYFLPGRDESVKRQEGSPSRVEYDSSHDDHGGPLRPNELSVIFERTEDEADSDHLRRRASIGSSPPDCAPPSPFPTLRRVRPISRSNIPADLIIPTLEIAEMDETDFATAPSSAADPTFGISDEDLLRMSPLTNVAMRARTVSAPESPPREFKWDDDVRSGLGADLAPRSRPHSAIYEYDINGAGDLVAENSFTMLNWDVRLAAVEVEHQRSRRSSSLRRRSKVADLRAASPVSPELLQVTCDEAEEKARRRLSWGPSSEAEASKETASKEKPVRRRGSTDAVRKRPKSMLVTGSNGLGLPERPPVPERRSSIVEASPHLSVTDSSQFGDSPRLNGSLRSVDALQRRPSSLRFADDIPRTTADGLFEIPSRNSSRAPFMPASGTNSLDLHGILLTTPAPGPRVPSQLPDAEVPSYMSLCTRDVEQPAETDEVRVKLAALALPSWLIPKKALSKSRWRHGRR